MLQLTQILTLAALALVAQEPKDSEHTPLQIASPVSRQGVVMGAPWHLTVQGSARAESLAISETVLRSLAASEQRLSNWNPDSELSRWNRSTPTNPAHCSPLLAREIARAAHWARATSGAFSPLAEPLIQAWDLRGEGRIPTAAELKVALHAASPDGITWRHGQPVRGELAQVASGGFGKGAAMDHAIDALDEDTAITLNLGGQVLVQGRSESIEIAHPAHRTRAIATWTVSSGSLATSGNSERAITVDGQRFSHILDGRTGRPAVDFGSVTVWCENALDADCLSTALFVLGPEAGLRLASELPGVRALFVETTKDGLKLRATEDCLGHLSSEQTILWFQNPQADNPLPKTTGKAK